MTLNELRALADEYFEWPIAHNKSTVTMTSALLFAQHVLQLREKSLEMHEKSLGTENNAGMDALREAAQQALEALKYAQQDRECPSTTRQAITALRAALAQEQAVTDDMRSAVRWAPSSAYWSERLREFFGPDAREGIDALERRLAKAQQAEPLNLSDRAVQRRLAAQWGYVQQGEPLTNQCGETCERAKLCAACARELSHE